jgi:hypothetical protein
MSNKKAKNNSGLCSVKGKILVFTPGLGRPGRGRIYFLLQKSQLFTGLTQSPTQKVPGGDKFL